jgi:beta-lactamase regulating signal transducer with metallopeptidase domain
MIAELLSENQFVWMCLWQSTACAAAGIIGSFILRHRPARAHQVLLLAIIAAVAVLAMSVLVKHLDLGLLSAEPAAVRSEREVAPPETAYAAAEFIAGDIIEYEPPAVKAAQDGLTAAVAAQKTGIPWSRMLSWAWIAASLILAARLGVTFVRGIRILRRATPVPCQEIQQAVRAARAKLGIAEDVSVLASRNIRSPVIWCWSRRPAFLVPNTVSQSSDGINWVSVLCHELAHYKRHDHISGLLAEIAACALPWNLLLWWTKSRLVKFSEQACDDWVLSSGQSGADYARSLLDLVPQSQLALLPTVVASKKELQTRVRRIVQSRCGDPRAGGRWAVLVTTVAACLALGTAFAQEGRTDKETPRREAAASESREEGEVSREQVREPREVERAELIQLRQTLLEKISGIERELKELPGDRDVEARELQARLRAIRDQIRDIDRKLAGPEREREDIRLREQRERETRSRELLAQREALQKRLRELELALERLPDGRDAEARDLQAALQEIREQMRNIEQQLRDAEQYQRQRREQERPEADPRMRELMEHREQLQEKARDMERRLAERPDGPEARELQAGLREIQEQIRLIKQELAELQRPPRERPERERPEQAQIEELRQAIARLVEQGRADEAERLERELRQITQQPPERPERRPEAPELEQQVRQLRNEVQGLRREMAELRELLKQLLQRPAPASSDAIRSGGQRPERERSPEAERREREPRPEKEEIGAERPRF